MLRRSGGTWRARNRQLVFWYKSKGPRKKRKSPERLRSSSMAPSLLLPPEGCQHHHRRPRTSTMRTPRLFLNFEYMRYHYRLISCMLLASTCPAMPNPNSSRRYTNPMSLHSHQNAIGTSLKKLPSQTRKHEEEVEEQYRPQQLA